jgi:hypothetical protein
MSKDKLVDMSIDPTKIKVKQIEVAGDASSNSKKLASEQKSKKGFKGRPSHYKGHGKLSAKVCVKKGSEVQQVERKTVESLFIANGWSYCPKKEWRASKK